MAALAFLNPSDGSGSRAFDSPAHTCGLRVARGAETQEEEPEPSCSCLGMLTKRGWGGGRWKGEPQLKG